MLHADILEKMNVLVASAFTRVFDALLPAHDAPPHLHRIDIW
jgi:hypothetical protein